MPKWTNKGHEFDELGNYFKKHNQITIYAESEEEVFILKKKLEFLNVKINIIHRLPAYNGGGYNGVRKLIYKISYKLKKIFYGKMNKYKLEKSIILFSNASRDSFYFMCGKGYIENKDLFMAETFFAKYLSVFAVYVCDKVYFPSNSFICTTVCTLNCRDCLNFAPYDKHKEHYDIERLKKNVDVYLKAVDRSGRFHISGGEPFSYPHLEELVRYIHNNYRDKIDVLTVVTNMTIMPSDELCNALKECDVYLELDDYTQTNPERKEMYNKVLEKLKKFDISIEQIVAGTLWNWVSVFPPKEVMTDENLLIKKYDCCGSVFQEIKDGKLFGCCYCEFIAQAKIFPYKEDDYFDLNTYIPEQKKELVEFRLKYNKKGYVEFCKYCNGLPPYNQEFIQPAIQTKGYLDWDINNPEKASKDL